VPFPDQNQAGLSRNLSLLQGWLFPWQEY
jgi:hypothetical protein